MNQAEIEFYKKYICPAEITTRFGLTPTQLRTLRDTNRLPHAIKVGMAYIWERATAEPVLNKFVELREARKDLYKEL